MSAPRDAVDEALAAVRGELDSAEREARDAAEVRFWERVEATLRERMPHYAAALDVLFAGPDPPVAVDGPALIWDEVVLGFGVVARDLAAEVALEAEEAARRMPGTTYTRRGPEGRLADFARFGAAELETILQAGSDADTEPVGARAEAFARLARNELRRVAELLEGYTTTAEG